nr:atherin-like [Aegilops tauschii subsp. strangulata]
MPGPARPPRLPTPAHRRASPPARPAAAARALAHAPATCSPQPSPFALRTRRAGPPPLVAASRRPRAPACRCARSPMRRLRARSSRRRAPAHVRRQLLRPRPLLNRPLARRFSPPCRSPACSPSASHGWRGREAGAGWPAGGEAGRPCPCPAPAAVDAVCKE